MPTTTLNIPATLIGVAETIIGTVPGATEWNISLIRFCNTDSVDHNLTIYNYDPGSESPGDPTSEYKQLTILAKSTFEYGPVLLPTGRRVSALADVASKISARVHGWGVTP